MDLIQFMPKPRVYWRNVIRMQQHYHPLMKAAPRKQYHPDSGRVLVLSPHIDDETIGAGGSLNLHVAQGDKVFVNYFADCNEIRKKEAERAAEILGFEISGFWPFQSRRWPQHAKELGVRLAALLADIQPDIIYLPSIWDRSHDHLMLNRLVAELVRNTGAEVTLYGMEIWAPVHPNLLINISRVASLKLAALQQYQSQNKEIDWSRAALALNHYRGLTFRLGEYAEGFIKLDSGSFLALWDKVYARGL